MTRSIDFSALLGLTITEFNAKEGEDTVTIKTAEGRSFLMEHVQDCCESVYLAEVIGDVAGLIGTPVTLAAEESEDHSNEEEYESCTWTFYKLATKNGPVALRWVGSSNGYYSESVYFYETTRFDT